MVTSNVSGGKAEALGKYDLETVWFGTIKEILPNCILTLVRNLFPNPHGIPYVGHKWN